MEGCSMGQVLHGSATTTEAIRRAIQRSQESLRALANRYGVNQKTVRKWKGRSSVEDMRTGPTRNDAMASKRFMQRNRRRSGIALADSSGSRRWIVQNFYFVFSNTRRLLCIPLSAQLGIIRHVEVT